MGGWNDLEPGILAVGATWTRPKNLIFAHRCQKSLPKRFLILTKNLDPQLVAPWAENWIPALVRGIQSQRDRKSERQNQQPSDRISNREIKSLVTISRTGRWTRKSRRQNGQRSLFMSLFNRDFDFAIKNARCGVSDMRKYVKSLGSLIYLLFTYWPTLVRSSNGDV